MHAILHSRMGKRTLYQFKVYLHGLNINEDHMRHLPTSNDEIHHVLDVC